MDGLWRSDDVSSFIELVALNREQIDFLHTPLGWPARLHARAAHARQRNTRRQTRSNIQTHFNVGTEFFQLVLDETMTYSCGIFAQPDQSLAEAQRNKYRIIGEKAGLAAADHVLDIGSGWGQFATHAAQTFR
ncbi:MAG: SAM-dependent methyltransferase [Dehalococcoidia bacterium]